jgi:hypothetical protein
MAYVEWLRVRGALKWTAIVLGILLVLACLARFTIRDFEHHTMGVHEMELGYFVAFGAMLALIVATILGAPFARENDGHLEVALTKPVARTGLALQIIGVDMVGIVATFGLGIVAGIALHTVFYPPWITLHIGDVMALGIGLLAPLSWYAMLAAATASLKRGFGAILGIAWPVALIVAALSFLESNNVVFALVHDSFWVLSRIDPLVYMNIEPVANGPAWLSQVTMLAVLALGYCVLAVAQWGRVEA